MSKKQLAELKVLDEILTVSDPRGMLPHQLAKHAVLSGVTVGPDRTGLRSKKKAALRKMPKKKRLI